jgi:hypothetical protein
MKSVHVTDEEIKILDVCTQRRESMCIVILYTQKHPPDHPDNKFNQIMRPDSLMFLGISSVL